jgi:predicted ArsR family transcriptional regulator
VHAGSAVHPTWIPVLTDLARLTILAALREAPALTTSELSALTHFSDRAVRRHLELLVTMGLVHEHPGERDGLTPGRPASRFALEPTAGDTIGALCDLLSAPIPSSPR